MKRDRHQHLREGKEFLSSKACNYDWILKRSCIEELRMRVAKECGAQ